MQKVTSYFLGLALLSLLLSGCTDQPSSEMRNFIERVKSQPVRPIQELPVYQPFEPVPFTAQNLRSPFEPIFGPSAERPAARVYAKLLPDSKRARELLESYPLDALKMVGTIERVGNIFVLIQDNQGIVHRVGIGNYIGQNFGKIVKITEKSIEIEELIQEGPEFVKRPVTMKLTE